MIAELLQSTNERGGTRIVFRFVDGSRVIGPFVEDRPSNEDHEAFVAARTPQPEVDYYAAMQAALDGYVGPGTYDAVRRALKDVGSERVTLGNVEMNVTYPEVTLPEDAEAGLRERVDGELGVGKFDAVKATLRAMGFSEVELHRKTKLAI